MRHGHELWANVLQEAGEGGSAVRPIGKALVLGVVIMQVGMPTVALLAHDPPSRFGFQMYSGYGDGVVELRDIDGHLMDVDWAGAVLPRVMRPELDWAKHLPDRLCQEFGLLESVTIRMEGLKTVRIRCER